MSSELLTQIRQIPEELKKHPLAQERGGNEKRDDNIVEVVIYNGPNPGRGESQTKTSAYSYQPEGNRPQEIIFSDWIHRLPFEPLYDPRETVSLRIQASPSRISLSLHHRQKNKATRNKGIRVNKEGELDIPESESNREECLLTLDEERNIVLPGNLKEIIARIKKGQLAFDFRLPRTLS